MEGELAFTLYVFEKHTRLKYACDGLIAIVRWSHPDGVVQNLPICNTTGALVCSEAIIAVRGSSSAQSCNASIVRYSSPWFDTLISALGADTECSLSIRNI